MRTSLWTKLLRTFLRRDGAARHGARRGPNFVTPRCDEFEPRLVPAAPTVVSIERVGPALSNASAIDFAVTFSEPVSGVDSADFAVATQGTVSTTGLQSSGSGAVYTVTINGIAGNGTVGLNLVDNNTIHNSAALVLRPSSLTFANQATFAAGVRAHGVITADFNGDGRLDLASSGEFATAGINVYLSNGDGTFKSLTPIS